MGYGTQKTKTGKSLNYWIVKNSWGSWWGEKGKLNKFIIVNPTQDLTSTGYFKMLRGKNLCKIASESTYPVLRTNPPKCLAAIQLPQSCQFFGDIFSSTGYVKSFCIDKYIRNYDDSKEDCYKNGMRLFQFDSDDSKLGLINYANTYWKRFYNVIWHIDGKNETGCTNLNNKDRTFVEGNGDCSLEKKSVCEFINIARKF